MGGMIGTVQRKASVGTDWNTNDVQSPYGWCDGNDAPSAV
jgi:hypothetical protein